MTLKSPMVEAVALDEWEVVDAAVYVVTKVTFVGEMLAPPKSGVG